jgi:hypothetical protein
MYKSACATNETTLLIVTGKIRNFTDGGSYNYTEQMLESLDQHTIKTKTTWTPVTEFTGPKLKSVMDKVGAYGKKIKIYTLDDYEITINLDNLYTYDAILALKMNKKEIPVDTFWPLWLMLPVSKYPELQSVKSDSKLVWQINKIVVE